MSTPLPQEMRAALARIRSLNAALEKIKSLVPRDVIEDPALLRSAVGAALAPKAPGGSPAQIHSAATAYGRTAEQYDQAFQDLQKVRITKLPGSWKGLTADAAAQQIQALEIQIENTVAAFGLAGDALLAWGDALLEAQHQDDQGRYLLTQAGEMAAGPVGEALKLAAEGCSDRIAAAQHMSQVLFTTTGVLAQATTFARAQQLVDAGPLIATLLATAVNPDGAPILSFTAFSVGLQHFDALSAADKRVFEGLLASSGSSLEAAYVWKALAAGNSLKTVEAFDKAIHSHGNDQQWLADHLNPDLTGTPGQMNNQGNGYFATYQGQQGRAGGLWDQLLGRPSIDPQGWDIYDQGNIGDCAAASTVVAKATVDPVYMLGLTTGYKAGAASIPQPVNDSPAAFHTRLQQAYTGAYQKDQANTDALANQLLARPADSSYTYQDLSGPADRQKVLSQIEATAGSGQPVFIDVESPSGTPPKSVDAHQLVVVGYNQANNQLQIYNPWGFTQNVDAKQFVDGQLPINSDGKPDGAMPVPYGVEMPNGVGMPNG